MWLEARRNTNTQDTAAEVPGLLTGAWVPRGWQREVTVCLQIKRPPFPVTIPWLQEQIQSH